MPLAKRERGPDASDGIAELLPYLRAIVSAFRIPAQDADDLLQDALVIYLVKRDDVRAPRSWLRDTAATSLRSAHPFVCLLPS